MGAGRQGRHSPLLALVGLGVVAASGASNAAPATPAGSGAGAEGRGPQGRGPEGRGLQQQGAEEDICYDNTRWAQHLWEYLSGQEKQAMVVLGWTQQTWDAAHPLQSLDGTLSGTLEGTMPQGSTRRLRVAGAGAGTAAPGAAAPPPSRRNLARERLSAAPARALQAQFATTATTTMTSTTYVPPSESTCYQDLTDEQQDAVRVLGYAIGTWHACKNPACKWPAGIPRPNAPCRDHTLYLEALYNTNQSWFDLTPLTQDALMLLGWSPSMWGISDKPETFARKWRDLFPREVEAAKFLGYQPHVWDGCMPDTPCLDRLERLEAKMSEWYWETTMPMGVQKRLGELGWQMASWTEGEEPASYRQEWNNLPHNQQVAARLLGYTRDTWEMCPDAACLDRFGYVKRRHSGRWEDMKAAEQRAWTLLEHSPELWAQRGMMGTRAMQSRWDELTTEQRRQASFLGHSLETWQGCNTDWTGPPANATNSTPEEPSVSRTVRARMVIKRPFSEISGNVYGNKVAQLPTSFMMIFQRSVARALFCGNPPLSHDPNTYLDANGGPLCILEKEFEKQRHRVRVVTVVEGSIIVDFILVANQTASETTAPVLYEALARQLESTASPLCQDAEFGRFARAATVEEVPLSHLSVDERAAALEFEKQRGRYNEGNACELHEDTRNGITRCPQATAACRGRPSPAGAWLLAAAAALAGAAAPRSARRR